MRVKIIILGLDERDIGTLQEAVIVDVALLTNLNAVQIQKTRI